MQWNVCTYLHRIRTYVLRFIYTRLYVCFFFYKNVTSPRRAFNHLASDLYVILHYYGVCNANTQYRPMRCSIYYVPYAIVCVYTYNTVLNIYTLHVCARTVLMRRCLRLILRPRCGVWQLLPSNGKFLEFHINGCIHCTRLQYI